MDLDGSETIIFLGTEGLGFLEGNIKVPSRAFEYHLERTIAKAGLLQIYKNSLPCRINKSDKWVKGKFHLKLEFIPDEQPIDYQI